MHETVRLATVLSNRLSFAVRLLPLLSPPSAFGCVLVSCHGMVTLPAMRAPDCDDWSPHRVEHYPFAFLTGLCSR